MRRRTCAHSSRSGPLDSGIASGSYASGVFTPPFSAVVVGLLLAVIGLAFRSGAESALRLPRPSHFGDVAALTLDESGRCIGDAHVQMDELPNGEVTLLSESRIEGGGGNRLTAELAPVDSGKHLKPLLEESRSEVKLGEPLGFLRIDHAARRMRCAAADGETAELELPDEDHVALAPMSLLFLPLARGEVQQVDFQIPICRGGPRLVDAKARLVPGAMEADGTGHLVEVRYELDFGPLLSAVVNPFLPRFSLWFDRVGAGDWMAYRMPLYSRGPTVVIMRTGLSPDALGLVPR